MRSTTRATKLFQIDSGAFKMDKLTTCFSFDGENLFYIADIY